MMTAVRVVLLAEGAGELAGQAVEGGWMRLPREPSAPLGEDDLGPGHLLLRRCLVKARRLPERAIAFQAPLLAGRFKEPRGSDLLNRRTLRQLLTWLDTGKQPDLAVVLVDRDGDRERQSTIERHLDGLPTAPVVIAVAREEFEAWLISDENSVGKILGRSLPRTPDPEELPRLEAKRTLAEWLKDTRPEARRREVRREIASTCDLDVINDRCAAFRAFLDALRTASLG